MNIQEFIAANKISIATEPITARADAGIGWEGPGARHWKVTLVSPGAADFVLEFSQGSAHKDPPTIADVLDCLASDSSGVENARYFEAWAKNYGYDTDSRKAEKTYYQCLSQAERLNKFLGSAAYNDLLWEVERI